MNTSRTRHFWPLALVVVLLALPTAGVVFSPVLYRMFKAYTGYGGAVRHADAPKAADVTGDKTITIAFDANVAPPLNWSFAPVQRSVTVKFGKPTKVYYRVKNLSDHPVVARAVFNVTPYQAASYFFKVQSFSSTNERLEPGESAEMPVIFFIDPHMLKDKDAAAVSNVTLSYTFYEQKNLTAAEIAATPDLAAAAKEQDASLAKASADTYENNAPRE